MKGRSYTPQTQSNQVGAPTAKTGIDVLINNISKFKGEMAKVLPKTLTAERMVRILTTEVRKNPKLAECTPMSFFGAILQCCQLGLEPGSALGHVYLIPRPNNKLGVQEVQMTLGYQGMIELVERSKDIILVAHEVYSNDVFNVSYGTDEKITHIPNYSQDRGNFVGVYAIGKYRDGRFKCQFMSTKQVDEVRKSSAAQNGPWKTHYDEMALKTVIRKLFKKLPKTQELAAVIETEEKIERDESQELHNLLEPEQLNQIYSFSQPNQSGPMGHDPFEISETLPPDLKDAAAITAVETKL